MQTDFIQATSGLILDPKQAEPFKVADQLGRGDDEGLTVILYGLAALHRLLERGCGNLDAQSLRRTKQGRLVLVCDPSEPTRCETTARNDVAGRYFWHLGEQPRGVDDLISLGVVAGELLVSPNKRPPLTGAHAEYRKDLAELIPKTALNSADRVRNQLIRSLLLCDKDPQLTASEFLRDHVALVTLTSDTRLKPASRADAIRQFLKSSLITMAIIALSVASLWMLWSSERSAHGLTQNELKASRVTETEQQQKLDKRQEELETSRATVAELQRRLDDTLDPGPNPDPPIPISVLFNDARYKLFSKDVNLQEDPTMLRLLKQTTLNVDEVTYADSLLNDLVMAAKVWWKMAESEAVDSEVSKQIAGQTNEKVSKILNVWYAQAATSEIRTITLKQSLVPSDYDTYRYRISFRDPNSGEDIYGKPYELFVKSGNTLGPESGNKSPYEINWKAGQPIPFWLEYWYYVSWFNVMTKQAGGALALPLLAKKSWQENGFSLSFHVSPLPGPPIDSAYISAGRISLPKIPDANGLPAKNNGLPIIISDEIK